MLNVTYLENSDCQRVIFKSNYELSWDTSYSYFIENKWNICSFSNIDNCWIRKLYKSEPLYIKKVSDSRKNRNKFEPIIDHNVVEWTPLRLKRLKHLISCETDKEVIMESFATSNYDQIKIGLDKLGLNRKKVSVKTYRKSIKYEPSIDKHD